MRMKSAFKALFGLSFFLLASCAWMRDQVVDSVAGFPASDVISDVKSTSDEYEQEKHEERVEKFNKEHEELLRARATVGTEEQETEQSVIIKKKKDKIN